jgi:hypothetical protein
MGAGAAAGLPQRKPSFSVCTCTITSQGQLGAEFRHRGARPQLSAALAVGKNWQMRRYIKEVAVTISVSFGRWILDNPLMKEETTRLECTIGRSPNEDAAR